MTNADRYRLPRTVIPARYEITLEPDLVSYTFSGTEAVSIELTVATDQIVLNAIELELDEAWLIDADGDRVDATVSYDEATERATLALARSVDAGDATLHARFRGLLNDKLHGFYRSTYTDDDGTEHTIATTQFEATDARRAFPCWDEPDFKAVFSVTLVIDELLTAVSNAAEVSRDPSESSGRVAAHFADTMSMSTYLVAFIVGPMEATDPVDVGGIPLRVIHLPGKAPIAQFALESGAFALRHFQDYFGLPYPGGKLDLVAIPDFAFGAMENMGCVTFRETALLVDPERSTQGELQRVADVIHHEIAHMWFGDLVTMKWWNGIWLNEAFATFMEMRCTDAFRPDWDRWTDFGISRSAAFDTDALASTRPIEFEVVSPEDAEGMFDILTYEKGAAVVRMLEQYLGEDEFRAGIRRYMEEHQYSNTETTDLWDAVEAATGEPARAIMDSWIFQGGHPMISVTLAGNSLHLEQEPQRYAVRPGDEDPNRDQRTWVTPILLRYGSDAAGGSSVSTRVLLEGDSLDVPLDFAADWVLVNSGGSGFYRVKYSSDLLRTLAGRSEAALTSLERYNLVDDAWASVLAGNSAVGEFKDFIRGFAEESDLSVWQRIVGTLGTLDRIVPDEARERLQGFVRSLVAPALHLLGDPTEGEADRTSALRGTLFEALGELGADEDTQTKARTLLEAGTADPDSVDPDLFDASVRVVASHGTAEDFDDFLARSKVASTPQDTLRYLGALADFPDAQLVTRLAELTLTDQVRSQDGPYLLRRALTNRDHRALVWAFVHRNWEATNERFPSNSISRMIDGVRSVTDPALAADIAGFLAEHPVPQGAKTISQHLERMKVSVALAEREGPALAESLG